MKAFFDLKTKLSVNDEFPDFKNVDFSKNEKSLPKISVLNQHATPVPTACRILAILHFRQREVRLLFGRMTL